MAEIAKVGLDRVSGLLMAYSPGISIGGRFSNPAGTDGLCSMSRIPNPGNCERYVRMPSLKISYREGV